MHSVSLDGLAPSFRRSLLAQNKSPRTVKPYLEAQGPGPMLRGVVLTEVWIMIIGDEGYVSKQPTCQK